LCEFVHHSISRLQRKSGLTGCTVASLRIIGGRLWADSVEKQRVAGAESGVQK
jgi:hypothetical protein